MNSVRIDGHGTTTRKMTTRRHEIVNPHVSSSIRSESHVRNILNELGFHSRTQIASWVAAPES